MGSDFWQKEIWQPPRFIGYKVLAILLAMVIWAYVTVRDNPLDEGTFAVPVELRNLDETLVTPETSYQVQVRVQGAANIIGELSSRDFTAYVDLSGMRAGEGSPRVQVDLPPDVSLVSLSPESIDLTLEAKVSETFAVVANVSGEPAENYTALLENLLLSPQEVSLSASASMIEQVGSVVVNADISDLESSYNRNLPVEVLDQNGNNITREFTISPESVNLVVNVLYEEPEATVAVRANLLGEPAEGYQISYTLTEPNTVRAFGDLATLGTLYYLLTEPIDISGISRTTSYSVDIEHDSNISLAQETVTVTVRVEPVATQTYTRNLLHTQNVAEGLECLLPDEVIKIEVAGPDTAMQGLDETRIVPYVDCAGITEPGDYELPVSFSLPANIDLVRATPETVTVTLIDTATESEGDGETAAEEEGA